MEPNFNNPEGEFLKFLYNNIEETKKLTEETRLLVIETRKIAISAENLAILAKDESKQALIRIEQLHQILIDNKNKTFWQRLFN